MPIAKEVGPIVKSCYSKNFCGTAVECNLCDDAARCKAQSLDQEKVSKNSTRLAILVALDGAWLSSEQLKTILLGCNKSNTLSSLHYHLCCLKQQGLVMMRRHGSHVYYTKSM